MSEVERICDIVAPAQPFETTIEGTIQVKLGSLDHLVLMLAALPGEKLRRDQGLKPHEWRHGVSGFSVSEEVFRDLLCTDRSATELVRILKRRVAE